MMLFAITSLAQEGRRIYEKYSGSSNISAVYISPAMFKLIGKIPDIEIEDNDVNLAPLIKSLSGMYVIDSENRSINASLAEDVEAMVRKGRYEILMEAKEDAEVVRIYEIGDAAFITSLVILSHEADECSFICIDGKMPREKLEQLMASQIK